MRHFYMLTYILDVYIEHTFLFMYIPLSVMDFMCVCVLFVYIQLVVELTFIFIK